MPFSFLGCFYFSRERFGVRQGALYQDCRPMEILRRFFDGFHFTINLDHFPNRHSMARQVCLADGERTAEGNSREFSFDRFFHDVASDQIAF